MKSQKILQWHFSVLRIINDENKKKTFYYIIYYIKKTEIGFFRNGIKKIKDPSNLLEIHHKIA